MPVTFAVDATKTPERTPANTSLEKYMEHELKGRREGEVRGKLLKLTNSGKGKYVQTRFNGFVGACLTAYNEHHHLVLGPDDVWVTVVTSLSRYINANAEKLRHLFVAHEGKVELEASGGGNIFSADYNDLISQISDQIDKHTKSDIRNWAECNFSTTTPLQKIVSKVVLMGAMQKYFEYKMSLCCGLPKVTLLGTADDWKSIAARVKKMGEFEDDTLREWSQVLGFVFNNFVDAFQGKVNTDFWNRIAHITGGGSGPRYLEGWVLSLIAFDEEGRYFLDDLKSIQATRKFGRLDTNDVPPSVVTVPVKINDNGREYDTLFYAGAMMATFNEGAISPALDWALVDTTEYNKPE